MAMQYIRVKWSDNQDQVLPWMFESASMDMINSYPIQTSGEGGEQKRYRYLESKIEFRTTHKAVLDGIK